MSGGHDSHGGGHGPGVGTIGAVVIGGLIAASLFVATIQGRGPFNESAAVYTRSTPAYYAPPRYVPMTPTYEAPPPRYVRVAPQYVPPPVSPGERRMLEAAYGE